MLQKRMSVATVSGAGSGKVVRTLSAETAFNVLNFTVDFSTWADRVRK